MHMLPYLFSFLFIIPSIGLPNNPRLFRTYKANFIFEENTQIFTYFIFSSNVRNISTRSVFLSIFYQNIYLSCLFTEKL